MSSNLNIPGNAGSHLTGAPTPANSYVGGGLQAPAPSSAKPTVEDVDEEDAEDDPSVGVNPASLLAQVRSVSSCLSTCRLPMGCSRRQAIGWRLEGQQD